MTHQCVFLNLDLMKSPVQSTFMSVGPPYEYKTKTKKSDSCFSKPFSPPQCNYTVLFCVVSLCFYSPALSQLLQDNTKLFFFFKELLPLFNLSEFFLSSLGYVFTREAPALLMAALRKTRTTEKPGKRGRNLKANN